MPILKLNTINMLEQTDKPGHVKREYVFEMSMGWSKQVSPCELYPF
jgi:hypothetical protein